MGKYGTSYRVYMYLNDVCVGLFNDYSVQFNDERTEASFELKHGLIKLKKFQEMQSTLVSGTYRIRIPRFPHPDTGEEFSLCLDKAQIDDCSFGQQFGFKQVVLSAGGVGQTFKSDRFSNLTPIS